MNIAGVEIGPDQPCRIVAEVSNNHNGSLALALRLIEECASAGVDFVKFQCYTPDELVRLRGDGPAPEPWGSQGWTMRTLYEKAQTPHEWFPALVAKCEEVGVPWFSSVFGFKSLVLLESLGCPAYKLAALDLVKHDAGWNLRGMIRLATDAPIIGSFRAWPTGSSLFDVLLYAPPGYPQRPADTDLREAGKFAGLSFHGTSPIIPMAAVEYGASMVEVHVQLDDVPSELEANVSLTISQVRELMRSVRTAGQVRA